MAQVNGFLANGYNVLSEEDHIRSEPLVEVYSVIVYSNSFVSNKERCEVYGTIYVTDGKTGEVCEVFNRPKMNPQAVSVDNSELAITGRKHSRIGKMKEPVVHVCLKEKVTGALIVEGSTQLDTTTTITGGRYFENFRHDIISSDTGGYVIIKYVALSYGVFAQVKVELMVDGDNQKEKGAGARNGEILEDNEEEGLNVYGSIHAHFGKAYKCNISGFQGHHLRSRLFHQLDFESKKVTFGSQIPLCREFVVVPSYSDLIFNLDLKDRDTGNQIACGDIPFKADYCGCFDKSSQKQGFRNVYVRVSVEWYEQIDLENDEQVVPFDLDTFEPVYDGDRPIHEAEHIEIFSVFMGREDNKPLSIYGQINAVDSRGKFCIFARGKSEPEVLEVKDNLLPLPGPPSSLVLGDSFVVSVLLKDTEGRAAIKGYMTQSVGMTRREARWFDRRLCSVIKGKGGFVAVHYIVFSSAIRARVNVQVVSSSGCGPVTLHGHIVTSYSQHIYETEYEKEYYRSWLLRLSEENAVQVAPNSKLPLLRSIVPVPVGSSLIVDVEMSASDQSSYETLYGTLEFGVGNAPKKIQKGSHAFHVSVAWF